MFLLKNLIINSFKKFNINYTIIFIKKKKKKIILII